MQILPLALILVACLLNYVLGSAIPQHARRQPVLPAPQLITLPLKRFQTMPKDIHPQMLMQQYINHASKRLARMTGREEPTEHQLRSEIHKRLYLLEGGSAPSPSSSGSSFKDGNTRLGMAVAHGHGKQSSEGMVNNGTAMPGNATGSGNATSSGGPATSGNSTGISPLDIQAANNGGLTPANPPTTNNSLGLAIEANDVAYIATIQIGTPARDFRILMDSGSADFWVGSENCQSSTGGGCGNHTFLGPQSSSSFVSSKTQFQVTYGSGAVEGTLCQDQVGIAGLTLNNHTFGVAAAETPQFASSSVPFDGLMGLAQSTLSQQNVSTPVESLASNGLIPAAITSFKISRLSDQLNDGEVTFGGLDSSKFVANTLITIPNVNQQGFWEGAIDAVSINGADSGLTGRTAILDTGTTAMVIPPADAQQLMQGLGGTCDTQQCTLPCTANSSLALSFGGSSFSINPSDLLIVPVQPNDPTGDCVAGIQPQQIGAPTQWLVGDVFLKNAYFSTDVGNNSISLAQLSAP
ncbi:acid protease [Pisolithus microcarpus]|nr:acid protease [Pisolithus microcarpus]